MSFFKASKKAEDVKQGGGGKHITKSGCYPVTVLAAMASVSKGGSTSVDLYVDHLGQKQVVYGNLRITNNDKSPNDIGTRIFNQLVIIADCDNVSDPVEGELPIGKKEALKTVAILEDIADVDVYMRVQMEYAVWNGNITEKKVIKSFFRGSDKASAEEIVQGGEIGSGFEREQKYVDHITFKDNLDQKKISEWIAAGRPTGTAGSGDATAAPDFGKKRWGS